MLEPQEISRYSKQIQLPGLGLQGQLKLKQTAVLVVGAGGLGCPALQYLSTMGVGHLGVVDGDRVEESNLHRQPLYTQADVGRKKVEVVQKYLLERNPLGKVSVFDCFFNPESASSILVGFDLVLDCSDNFDCRYLLNDACGLAQIPLISAAVTGLEGHVALFDPKVGPCYRCLFPHKPARGQVQTCMQGGVLGVVPGILGALQGLWAIQFLLSIGDPLHNKLLTFDGLSMSFQKLHFEKDPACALCGTRPSIQNLENPDLNLLSISPKTKPLCHP